ncbi:site-specific integrase [Microbacterium sp. KR10-403]|uniref:site-specific integrase n=1 Tax=Microbacterium sp. KR10-403 TaxID=3158581 RepID=UPI0032E424D1
MSAAVVLFRRCGCRLPDGRQYPNLPGVKPTDAQRAAACPKLTADPKHGAWGYSISGGTTLNRDGKRVRVQVRKSGFRTRAEALTAGNTEASAIGAGTWVKTDRQTVAEWMDEWLPRHALTARHGQGLRTTTREQYARYIANDIKPSRLGAMELREVRRAHIVAFLDGLRTAGRGVSTLHKLLVTLQAAFSAAVADERIPANPALRIPLEAEQRRKFIAWEPWQVGRFLDEASRHRLGAVYELAVFTGLRRAELAGLRWVDVDLTQRRLHIVNARVQAASGVVVGKPKTENSVRTVSLDDQAVAVLLGWKLAQDADRDAAAEAWTDSGYVFTDELGAAVLPDRLTRTFEKLRQRVNANLAAENATREAAGEDALPLLPKTTLHGLRHEHASLWIASGGDISMLSKRLGHSSISVTSDIYVSRVGDADRAQAEQVAAMIPRGSVHTVSTQQA